MARIIKKYTNRRLYDSESSRTTTLAEIANLIKEGIDVQVIDNETGKNITDITLIEILREEVRDAKEFSSFPFLLKEMIKEGRTTINEFIRSSLVASVEAIALTEKKAKELVRNLIDRKKISEKEGEYLIEELLSAVKEREKIVEEKIRRVADETVDKLGVKTKKDLEEKIRNGSFQVLDFLGLKEEKDIEKKVEVAIKKSVEAQDIPSSSDFKNLKTEITTIKKNIKKILEKL